MFKMGNRALKAAAVVAACACFLGSMGAGVKFRTFTACGSCGVTENPNVDGMCMVKYDANAYSPRLGARGITTIHMHITGLLPNTLYGIKVDSDGSGISDPQAFTTDSRGDGDYHRDIPQDATSSTTCVIYVWDGTQGDPVDTGDDIFTVTNDELRVTASI
jgi:hypothetical protein